MNKIMLVGRLATDEESYQQQKMLGDKYGNYKNGV